jgi:hypothetical protein
LAPSADWVEPAESRLGAHFSTGAVPFKFPFKFPFDDAARLNSGGVEPDSTEIPST